MQNTQDYFTSKFASAINWDRINNMSPSELNALYQIVKALPDDRDKYYDSDYVQRLINKYYDTDSTTELYQIQEGCLLEYGLLIITADKCKTAIIKECYINSQSSGYSVRLYRKTPKKYQEMIDEYLENLNNE